MNGRDTGLFSASINYLSWFKKHSNVPQVYPGRWNSQETEEKEMVRKGGAGDSCMGTGDKAAGEAESRTKITPSETEELCTC